MIYFYGETDADIPNKKPLSEMTIGFNNEDTYILALDTSDKSILN